MQSQSICILYFATLLMVEKVAKLKKKDLCVIIYSYSGNGPRRTRLINQFPPPGGLWLASPRAVGINANVMKLAHIPTTRRCQSFHLDQMQTLHCPSGELPWRKTWCLDAWKRLTWRLPAVQPPRSFTGFLVCAHTNTHALVCCHSSSELEISASVFTCKWC